jgi:selenocysteine-specific elongation factor
MRSLILGTAGHIDHGKTALVRALTGTDTDRLKEEKARGITIELGFAELAIEGGPRFGVVDVPGHEAFVRAMVAGAAGMDVVMLVVAADEGVMPQTREHLAIVELLGVSELVVALTKCDVVDAEWLELVESDVEDVLDGTRYGGAVRVATSAIDGRGLDDLRAALAAAAERAGTGTEDDLTRLPLDRVFTIQGTGTVVTGTLWTGSLRAGERVRILPEDLSARVRGVQVHGRDAELAVAGDRTAVALTGEGSDREVVGRGSTLVTSPEWQSTWMLTARAEMLADTQWSLKHNQRVHVHHGTAEVLARVAMLEDEGLEAGQSGWIQLRLESPLVARARDRLVLRAYSPVTTIGGCIVAEPMPPKRHRLDAATRSRLGDVLAGDPPAAVGAALDLAGWSGLRRAALPLATGLRPAETERALGSLAADAVLATPAHAFGPEVSAEARRTALDAVREAQETDALRPAVPLAEVRASLPAWAHDECADAAIDALVREAALEAADGGVRTPGFQPRMTADQEAASDTLLAALTAGGLAPPFVDELPEGLRGRSDFRSLLRRLESLGQIRSVADGLYVSGSALDEAADRIVERLAGQSGLGPADFRDVLEVTRKHLIPLLNYFDGLGTTIRHPDGREVPPR